MSDDLTATVANALRRYCDGEMWPAARSVLCVPQLAGAIKRDAQVLEIIEWINEGIGDTIDPWQVLYRIASLYPEAK